jgi:ribose transport system permease protein
LHLPRFLSVANLSNNANLLGLRGIFGIGVGMVIITGGIDLSIGSMIAFCGMLLVLALTAWHWSPPVAVAFVLGVAALLGLAHALLITRMRIQPFVVTLCGLMIYRGLARYISGDMSKGFGGAEGFKTLQWLASGKLFGLPMPFIFLVVIAIVMWVVLHRSVYGRYLFAVGRNEQATLFSGVNARLVISFAYILAAVLTGISAILYAFYTNNVSPSIQGNTFELYGIAAAVVGGCSLRGGEGSILGIVIGTTLLIMLENLVTMLGIDSSLNSTVMGSVVLIGVLADEFFKRRAAKKTVKVAK